MSNKNKNQSRQGDVFIERVPKEQKGKPLQTLVLAHGEATGHHHSVEDGSCATLLELDNKAVEIDVRRSTRIVHQEHAPIPLKRGRYRVTRQREYSPEAIRNVAD